MDQSSPNLVGMYGRDRSLQAVFQSTISSSDVEIFAIKSQNGVVKTTFFGPKILGDKDPQNQMQTFYAPTGKHQVGKFDAIPPTDPDDVSLSTPDFGPIFEFHALKNCWGQTHPH